MLRADPVKVPDGPLVAKMRRRIPTQETERAFSRERVPHRLKVLSSDEIALCSEDVHHLAIDSQTGWRRGAEAPDDVADATLKPFLIRLAVHHETRERCRRVENPQAARGRELVDRTTPGGELDGYQTPMTRANRHKEHVPTTPTVRQMRGYGIDERLRVIEEMDEVLADDAPTYDALAVWRHLREPTRRRGC